MTTTTDWTPLAPALSGSLIRPGEPGYAAVRRRHIGAEAEPLPRAVAQCRTVADVAAALAFARTHRVPFALRAGGHSYAGHSSTEGLLIDVARLDTVTVTGDRMRLGAGARIAEVHDALCAAGRTLPTGSCPTVGLTGSTLAGGFGFLGRRYGLTADSLVSADVVLADGRQATVDERRDPDLFWALRGVGDGAFAAVVALEFMTRPAVPLASFHYRWPIGTAVEVIDAWQRFAPDASDTVTAHVSLLAPDFDDEEPYVDVFGVGDDLRPLLASIGSAPAVADVRAMSPAVCADYLAGRLDRAHHEVVTPPGPHERSGWMFGRSEFVAGHLSEQAIAALVESIGAQRIYGAQRDVEFTPFGGAYARVAADATAFAHRAARFLVAHRAMLGVNATAAARANERAWLDASWTALRPHGTGGVYPGYADPALAGHAAAYHASNLPRLVAVKRAYDPETLFRSGHDSTTASRTG